MTLTTVREVVEKINETVAQNPNNILKLNLFEYLVSKTELNLIEKQKKLYFMRKIHK